VGGGAEGLEDLAAARAEAAERLEVGKIAVIAVARTEYLAGCK